jgi:hypothetical protein
MSTELKYELGDCFWYWARHWARGMRLDFNFAAGMYDLKYDEICRHTQKHHLGASFLAVFGELAGLEKKLIRDGATWDVETQAAKEGRMVFLMLCLFHILRTEALSIGSNLDEILAMNVEKLGGRDKRGTLQGDGDKR